MKQERIRFEELDFIYPQHFLEINSFKIPIYAHIKNIRTKYVDEITIRKITMTLSLKDLGK